MWRRMNSCLLQPRGVTWGGISVVALEIDKDKPDKSVPVYVLLLIKARDQIVKMQKN